MFVTGLVTGTEMPSSVCTAENSVLKLQEYETFGEMYTFTYLLKLCCGSMRLNL